MSNLNDLLEVMKEHQKMDRLIQGSWIDGKDSKGVFKGCFFGCAMQMQDGAIEKACKKYGLPLWIGYWSEKVFEGLPKDEAIEWPVKLLTAISSYNGDTDELRHKLAIKRLTRLSNENSGNVKDAIDQAIEYHKNPTEESRVEARLAARSSWSSWAEDSAAKSAKRSATWSTYSNAESSADSAESAVKSTAELAGIARADVWKLEAEYFMELVNE